MAAPEQEPDEELVDEKVDESQSTVNNYPAPRVQSGLLKFAGWTYIVMAFLAVLFLMGGEHKEYATLVICAIFILPIIGISLLGFSELIHLFIRIEENTRPKAESEREDGS